MKKKDFVFLLFLLLSLVIVFFDLFTLQKAFLSGDHREQQYPWAKFYQEHIRQFHLPWWTTEIQCGFPILAEGQIGAFYPLNFIFLLLLPIKWAYNYEILFQYFLGACLFYYYLRRSLVSDWGAFFATLIYLFGSCQGGYFYHNLISQKVVIWLPLTLILIDRLLEKESFAGAFFLSLVFVLEIFGGYLQVAIYSIIYSCLYFLFFWFRKRKFKSLRLFTVSGFLTIFFSLVQWLPTLELSLLSSRVNAPRGLAYVGSMNPFGLATLFYSSWDGFLGSEFYVGILGFFFFLIALASKRGSRENFFLWIGTVGFLLLSLGKLGLLYAALVKLTGFQGFRTPIKFLFFVAFSMAVLAGFGFDKFFKRERDANGKIPVPIARSRFLFQALGAFMIFLPLVLTPILKQFKPEMTSFLQNYVQAHVYGKAGHPFPLDFYMQKAIGFYEDMIRVTGLANRDTLNACFLILGSVLFVTFLMKSFASRNKWKLACVLFLFLDLFLYGFTSIKGDYEPFDSIDSPNHSAIVGYLKSDHTIFRVMEVYREPNENRVYPVFPNFNMLYKIDDIGVYSPLAMRDYKNFIADSAYVNDSLSLSLVTTQKVVEHLKNLSFLNVKYLLSTEALASPDLKEIMREGKVILYRNEQVVSRAFFVPGKAQLDSFESLNPSEVESVPVEYHSEAKAKINYEAKTDGLIILTDIFYRGWRLTLNGKSAPILRDAKLFRGVPVKKGSNELVFEYKPRLFQKTGLIAFATFILISVCLVMERFGRKKELVKS